MSFKARHLPHLRQAHLEQTDDCADPGCIGGGTELWRGVTLGFADADVPEPAYRAAVESYLSSTGSQVQGSRRRTPSGAAAEGKFHYRCELPSRLESGSAAETCDRARLLACGDLART